MVLEKIISAIASITMMSSVAPSGLSFSVLPEDSVVEQASVGDSENTNWTVIDYTQSENQNLSEEDLALMREDNWLNRLVVEHSATNYVGDSSNKGGSKSGHSLEELDLNDFLAVTMINKNNSSLIDLPKSIKFLSNLKNMQLYRNSIVNIPEEIGNLINLTSLNIGGNAIGNLPNSIFNLTNLTELDLYGNKLTSLSESVGNLVNINILNLSYNNSSETNKISELPDSICNLANLTQLNLGYLNLTSLPDSIGNLVNLTSLDLSNNILSSLPDSICNLTNLTSLNIQRNKLTSLPESIGNLTNLSSLVISCSNSDETNKISELPDSICNLANLTELKLGCLKLDSLPNSIGNLVKLTNLDLIDNKLTSLPDSIGNLNKLTVLNLNSCKLTSLPDSLGNLSSLTRLDLRYNNITSLPDCIYNLTNLRTLQIDRNGLISLSESIGNLTKLKTLSLSENKLTSLPDSINSLTNLTSLNLNYNYLCKKYTDKGDYSRNFIDSESYPKQLSDYFIDSLSVKIGSDKSSLVRTRFASSLPELAINNLTFSSSNQSIIDNNGNAVGCGICNVTLSLSNNPEGNKAGQAIIKVQVNGNVQMTASQPNKNITNQDSPIDWSVTSEEGYDRMVLPDGTESTETSGTWNAPSNGTYTFKAYDSVGNFTQTDVVVSNIDKTNPVLNITGVPQGDSVQGPVTLNYTTSDEHYKKIKLPNGNSSNGTEGEYVVRRNGTYLFTAFDTAGNSTTETLKITNLVRRNDVSADDADNAIQDANDDLTLDTLQSAMDAVMGMPNGEEKDSRVSQITALQQQYLAKSDEDITDKLQVINSMIDNTNGNKIMGVSNDGVDRSSTIDAIKTLEPKDRSSLVTNLVEATDNLEGTFIDGGNKLESSTNNVKLEVGQTLTPKDLVNVTYNGVTLSEDQINSLKIIKETGSESLLSDSNKAVKPGVAKVRVKLTSESDNETSNHSSLTASTNPFVSTVGKIVDKAIRMFSVNADPSEDPTETDPIDVTIVEKPVISSGTTSANGDVTVKYDLNETAQLSLSTQVVDFGVSTGISEVSQETPMTAIVKSSAVYDLDLSPQTNLVNEEDSSVEIPSTKASISFNDAVDFTALPVPNSSLNLVTNGNATTALENRSKVYNMNFKIGDVIGSKSGKYTMPIRITLTQK